MDYELLRKLQLCELNILKEFTRICNENDLKYYLGTGTLLGAVRHKGFIPWDDDVDVYMLREDYEKFLKIANKVLPENLTLHNFRNDDSYTHYQSAIMDKSFKIKLNHTTNGIYKSAWMDIWPIDMMPSNKISFFIRKYKLLYIRFKYQSAVFDNTADMKKKRPLKEKILMFIVDKFNLFKNSDYKNILEKFDKELKKTVKKPKYYINGISYYKSRDIMPIEVYGEGKMYKFEDLMLRGPNDYDYYLTSLYGDYMTPPSEEEKNRHYIEFLENE